MTSNASDQSPDFHEVVELCSQLIAIDSSNTGDPATSAGEREAAEWVVARLEEVGYEPTMLGWDESRQNVIVRVDGASPDKPALLLHGHLDVVPAVAEEWSVDPFAGVIKDGFVWGRGAIDMKDMVAMMVAILRRWKIDGVRPDRTIVFCFTADEEHGGVYGAHWLVKNHPEMFEGCTEAVGEVGGFSHTVDEGTRVYPIMTGEKGIAWMKITATGTPGHGSMVHQDNAVAKLADAVSRVAAHQFPIVWTDTLRQFVAGIGKAMGTDLASVEPEVIIDKLGALGRIIGATLRNTANPTGLQAGYKVNVIPSTATATLDCRIIPGQEEEFERQIDELLGPDITREWIVHDKALEISFDTPLVEAMTAALKFEDDASQTLPFLMSGGTDAKAFVDLGMSCYGFSPLKLPPDLDFAALFHGIDERVPVDALTFGARVLNRFLLSL